MRRSEASARRRSATTAWRSSASATASAGLAEDRSVRLDRRLSGILTVGGTILGTSRDKPHRMLVGRRGAGHDRRGRPQLRAAPPRCPVCLGGGGTAKNALRLVRAGLNVITLPKTIDNDVVMTDATFGFATALDIATDAIDRLHSTAHSHHRIIVVEIMGHRAGWLTLGAGIAGRRRRDPDPGDPVQRRSPSPRRSGGASEAGPTSASWRWRRGRGTPRTPRRSRRPRPASERPRLPRRSRPPSRAWRPSRRPTPATPCGLRPSSRR